MDPQTPSRHTRVARRNPSTLTNKMVKFCQEYVIDFNASAAAARAGYVAKAGPRLLKRKDIQDYVDTLRESQLRKANVDAQAVVDELVSVAFADAFGLGELGCKGSDKIKALELLGKRLKLFVDPDDKPVQQQVVVLRVPDNGRGPQ